MFLRLVVVQDDEGMLPSFTLGLLGISEIPNCPEDSKIFLTCHPSETYMFSGANLSNKISIWSLNDADGCKWGLISSIDGCTGLISMSIDSYGSTLTSLHADDEVHQWKFDFSGSEKLTIDKSFRRSHYNMKHNGVATNSCASALDTFRNDYIRIGSTTAAIAVRAAWLEGSSRLGCLVAAIAVRVAWWPGLDGRRP